MMLGHSNAQTTERYLHGLDGRQQALFSKYKDGSLKTSNTRQPDRNKEEQGQDTQQTLEQCMGSFSPEQQKAFVEILAKIASVGNQKHSAEL